MQTYSIAYNPNYSKAFNLAVQNTLNYEGGYTLDPKDPGGETNFGISKRSYPNLDIKNLTKDQAVLIYYNDFWKKIQGDAMPAGLAFNVFDEAVNTGVGEAVQMLQKSLNVKPDGVIGPNTLHAMNNATNDNIISFGTLRVLYYFSCAEYATYGPSNWIPRAIGTLVKSMAQ